MWMEKMRRGVLQVSTDSGVRYVQPSFSERLQLLWTFRNFNVLSEQILNQHERHVVEELCVEDRLFRPHLTDCLSVCVIGTLELSHAFPAKKAPRPAMVPGAQRSSA